MRIEKIGHCCLLIEEQEKRILTDPGAWTTNSHIKDIDLILITHEHSDHYHIDTLKTVLNNNPQAIIYTNNGVAKLLATEKIPYTLVEHNQAQDFHGVVIEGFGESHAPLYPSVIPVPNTGYFVAKKFFYPGDAFFDPQRPVDILALPVAGPWMKLAEAIDYAKKLNPKSCFPVHDGMLKFLGSTHSLPEKELKAIEINFVVLEPGKSHEF